MSPRVERSEADQPSVLANQVLLQCAESCERTLQGYVTRVGLPTKHELFRELLPAIATVRTAVDLLDAESSRPMPASVQPHDAVATGWRSRFCSVLPLVTAQKPKSTCFSVA
jgi:hypothetical protein